MEQFNQSVQDNASVQGRIILNQRDGRIEIFDEQGKPTQWIGNLGKDVGNNPLNGVLSFDVNGVATMIQGVQSGGFGALDYGVKIAQQNISVLTAASDELIMSTAFNQFKIVATGSGSLEINAPGGASEYVVTSTIVHNLGYAPTIFAFGGLNATAAPADSRPASHGGILIEQTFENPDSPGSYLWGARAFWQIISTDTTLYIGGRFSDSDTAYNGDYINFKYYLCRETAL